MPRRDPYVGARPRPAMRGRYLINNARSVAVARAFDSLLQLLSLLRRKDAAVPLCPRRILVANWAHLGDVILALPALEALRKHFPKSEIGLLAGSWAQRTLEDTKVYDRLHLVDHFRMNRNVTSAWKRFSIYCAMRARAINEIRSAGYDVAIDLYPYFPPASPLFYAADIPVRIGFTSGGFGPLLTLPVDFVWSPRSMMDYARDVLNPLLRERSLPTGSLRAAYPGHPRAPLPVELSAQEYVVVHMGTNASIREWPEPNWVSLIRTLVRDGCRVVLTGAGTRERERIARINAVFAPATLPLADLPWELFVSVLAQAAHVVCLDSVAAHIAACFDVSTTVIFSGTNHPLQWGPVNARARLVTAPVACAPCYRRRGCDSMACVKRVSVEAVIDALHCADLKQTRITV